MYGKYCKSQNLLTLAKANANTFNAIKVFKSATKYMFIFLSKLTLM